MQIAINTANRPKPGAAADSCEDAWGPLCGSSEATDLRCAVADGASTSAFARPWAQILVRDFLAGTPIAESQAAWREIAADTEGPWWLGHKVAEGAHAALVGLELCDDQTWQAQAWGDVCLFHVRSSQILASFPLQSAAEFPDQPTLLCSVGENPVPHRVSGSWEPGDRFLVASDAVARQLFGLPITNDLWQQLAPTNDDMTLMHIHVS